MTIRLFVIAVLSIIVCALTYSLISHSDDLLFNWIFKTPWLLCLLVWNLYALLDARREALYFTAKARYPGLYEYTDHSYFFIQRGMVLILMGFILQRFYPLFLLAGMFPFMHDGFYYLLRDNLDNSYPKRWIAKPKKSTAMFDVVFKYFIVRLLIFLLSLGLYLYLYIHG